MNKREKFSLSMENVYFADDWRSYRTCCDAVLFYASCIKPEGWHHGIVSSTILIDLQDEEETLMQNMRKSTRQDIKRAQRNTDMEYEYVRFPETDQLQLFCSHYDAFAAEKRISPADACYLEEARQKGILSLLYVKDHMGQILCGAADFILSERCYGAYAFNTFRVHDDKKTLGQANKLLYWLSIQHGKHNGCRLFDMAGLAGGVRRGSLEGIDEFKRGFGGRDVVEYDFYKGFTLKGKFLILILKLIRKRVSGWD